MLKLGRMNARPRLSPDLLSYIALAAVTFIFLVWRLASLPSGLSKTEVLSRNSSANLHGLLSNPLNAPYHLLQHLLNAVHAGSFCLRLTSVAIAVLIVAGFFRYMRSLFGRLIGLLGALLLVSLPFFSISARQAAPQIMLFLPILIMYIFSVFTKSERKPAAWPVLCLLAGISIYTPGLFWWLVTSLVLSHKKLSLSLSRLPKTVLGAGFGLLCLCLTPLVVILSLHPSRLKELLLIPSSWLAPLHFGSELLHMAASLVVRSPGRSLLLLDSLPILNITLIALVVFGGYALFTAARSKAVSLGLCVVLGVLLAAVAENIAYLAIAVPALAIAVTAGLRYLYIEWRSIFPRNPVPKTFALVLIAAVALAQLYYGLNYTLHAWPHSPPIRQAYVLK